MEVVIPLTICLQPKKETRLHHRAMNACSRDLTQSKAKRRNGTMNEDEFALQVQLLEWDTLKERRKRNRLSIFYKIHNRQTGIKIIKHLTLLGRISRHINEKAYEVPFAHTDYFKFSYFPRTIRQWNVLSSEAVNALSLMAFVNYL